jgi:hypothetical protein
LKKPGREVSAQEAARLKGGAVLDPSLQWQDDDLDWFRLPDGRVLVTLEDLGGTLYTDAEYRERRATSIEEARNFSDHYLHGRELPGDFIARTPALVNSAKEWLAARGLQLEMSMHGLGQVDEVCKAVGRTACNEPPIFPTLVAVVGEVMRREKNGEWAMRTVLDNRGVEFHEAWVRNDARWEWDASFVVYQAMDEEVDLWTLTNLAVKSGGWSQSSMLPGQGVR